MRTKCWSIATFHRPIHSHWSLPLSKEYFRAVLKVTRLRIYLSRFVVSLTVNSASGGIPLSSVKKFSFLFCITCILQLAGIVSHCWIQSWCWGSGFPGNLRFLGVAGKMLGLNPDHITVDQQPCSHPSLLDKYRDVLLYCNNVNFVLGKWMWLAARLVVSTVPTVCRYSRQI
jgi:hypothetical protein